MNNSDYNRKRYDDFEPISMANAKKMKDDYREVLKRNLDREIITFQEDMSKHCSFKAGGKAETFIEPRNKMELLEVLEILSNSDVQYMVIGNGSNILIKDGGYKGAIVKIGKNFSNIKVDGTTVKVGAGALLSTVSREASRAGLKGMEFASGIPGNIGGAIFMNAGAYDEEMKDIVAEVRVVSKDGREEVIWFPKDLRFGYRSSAIQDSEYIVLGVTLDLKKGDKAEIEAKVNRLNEQRNLKQPVEFPSAGSFFKRPKNNYAGKLVQDAGLKGLEVGGAKVSEKHAGFIINQGGATATDIIELMNQVQTIVKDKFGVVLEPEVRIIGD